MLDRGRRDQNVMMSIMMLSPHEPMLRKKPAIAVEKGTVIAERRPNGMIHIPKIGMVVRLAGIETRDIR